MAKQNDADNAQEGAAGKGKQPAPTPPTGLDAGAAKIILNADLRNLTRKVQAGRTLTSGDRRMLASVG